jgi:type IV pilus assembly protein PilM
MGLFDFFKKEEHLIAVDVGSTGVKLLELDTSGDKPRLVNLGFAPLTGEIFSNNAISASKRVSEQITALLESNSINDRRVVTAVPGSAVFTKKIKVPKMDAVELASHIQFEAGNFIPHNVAAVRLDYHVVGPAGKNQLEVLVVAVKNEIIDSFVDCFNLCGLEVAVIDVDYFALQNTFEMAYPELSGKTVALLNIGARYSSINVCRGGDSLFTGDIPVGGKVFTDALVDATKLSFDEAERLKRTADKNSPHFGLRQEVLDTNVEYAASEFNRQLSFFWNASGSDEGIDLIMLCGGSSVVPGLKEELSEKTGLDCQYLDPFLAVEAGEGFDRAYLNEMSPLMGVSVGMGIRKPGDRIAYSPD